ncbi:hypothetical protein EON63_17400 [archaeon]|nr:MAG: hypothetical protein EON63_17400 [archaeon]
MTISLTVMILEATGDMQYVLPLMLTVLTARCVGNIFTEGIYDMYIFNKRYFLALYVCHILLHHTPHTITTQTHTYIHTHIYQTALP